MAEFDSEASLSPKSTGEVRVEFGVGFSLPISLLSGPSRIHVLHGCSTGVPMVSHVLGLAAETVIYLLHSRHL